MKLMILTMVLFFANVSLAKIETKDFEVQGLKKLSIKNTEGSIQVSTTDKSVATVRAEKVKFDKGCQLSTKKIKGQLQVLVDQKESKSQCEVNFEIEVPRDIALDVKGGSGKITVTNTKGEIDLKLGSGDVSIDAEVSRLNVRSGSGSLNAKGLVGASDIKTGSGEIALTYLSAPERGSVEIKTGSGDATVFLPSSTKILTNFSAGSGRVYNELGDTKEATFQINMKAGSGDLSIKKIR